MKGPVYVMGPDGVPRRTTRSELLGGGLEPGATVVYGAGRAVEASDFGGVATGVLRTTVAEAAASLAPVRQLRQRAAALGVDVTATLSHAADAADVEWSSNDWCLGRQGVIEAADIVVTRDGGQGVEVLCIRRSHPPFASTWSLPGGMRDEGEELVETADRELTEETGLDPATLGVRQWLGELEATDWDPRATGAHVGAVRYHVGADVVPVAADDAVAVEWVPVEDLASGAETLAFGHAHWLAEAFSQDPSLAARLEVVSEAARRRNRRLISQVNARRAAARRERPEVEEISLEAVDGAWGHDRPRDVFARLDEGALSSFCELGSDPALVRRAATELERRRLTEG